MTKIANEIRFGNVASYVIGTDPYDSTKLGLGSLIYQNTDTYSYNKYISPPPIGFGRPVETGAAIPAGQQVTIKWTDTKYWLFSADVATAAATRRIQLYEYNKTTLALTWKGFVVLAFPFAGTQGTYTIVSLMASYDAYTTGTASVSGTTVTGSGTAWSTSGLCVGNRIGFGSTNPNNITRWYEISAVSSDTSLTLTESASIVDGPYVIEDLRLATTVTNGVTSTNGGTFLAKGLRVELFNGGGPTIPAATTTDGIRANYWIADAVTSTNTAGIGSDIIKTDWSTSHLYVLDTVANPVLFKYNIRASLTGLASGRTTSAFVLKSGAHGALTGAPVQANNFVIATTSHGAGSRLKCGYFTTATRFYRTQDVTTITAGSTSWAGSVCLEVPPGGTVTHTATGTIRPPAWIPEIDRFVIPTGTRAYLTKFREDGSQWDRIFLNATTQTLQVNADNTNTTPWPSYSIGAFWADARGGILSLISVGTTAVTNFLYLIPVGADWESVDADGSWVGSKQYAITPEISTPNVASMVRVYANYPSILGSRNSSGKNLGTPSEPINIYYRTSGISDDSGSWILVPVDGDMSSVDSATSIQFRIDFRVAGNTCIPARVNAIGVIYEDLSTDSHYQPSVGKSSINDKQFAWRFSTAFGSTVPRLRIRLYDAVVGSLLYDDDSVTQSGTWEKSTNDGGTWGAYNTTDKANETTYIRFTPASLVDNVKVRALLTQY